MGALTNVKEPVSSIDSLDPLDRREKVLFPVSTSVATSVQPKASRSVSAQPRASRSGQPIALKSKIFDSVLGWQNAKEQHHPRIRLRMSTAEDDYRVLGVQFPRIAPTYIDVVTDSGAQSCLWGLKDFHRCGFKVSDLIQVEHQISAANRMPIKIVGAIILRLAGQDMQGKRYECAVMVFVSPDAEDFFLSKEAMQQLAIVSKDFPRVGAASVATVEMNALPIGNEKNDSHRPEVVVCDCPKRTLPPKRPTQLPFPCTPENNEKMKLWLLERYASSTFNQCPHQILPTMAGPPLKIHVDPDAKPVAVHKPASVPLHFQDQVIADLKRDITMGVLEYPPVNEPVAWCHRMVITTKHDGTPRRTVDMSSLNKNCRRETHASKTPFQMARSIPRDTWKSVCDAWNGYNSLLICEEDRHLTTFITQMGRLRYIRAPQGALPSGDGYNQRFDTVLVDMCDKERCVDDTAYWDKGLEEHWWRNIDFIELTGNAGIVLNPKKFQFAQKEIEFAGFKITSTGVEPLPKYLDAIRRFPTPRNITDVRAWFGLTNQVAHYAQLRDLVTPFRPLLKKNARFDWTTELDEAFEESKMKIVEAIKKGVEIFDKNLMTCLSTDWSKSGIGYYLTQKHCECQSEVPGCCDSGWRITLAGSRSLLDRESRYAPVEGEMLAVAYSLEQTKYFTQGCNNLIILTDHKPLLKLLGDRTLDEIHNTRLFRLKQRTMPWLFKMRHHPGKLHFVADATSRNPIGQPDELDTGSMESEIALINGIRRDVNKIRAVTWERIKQEMEQNANMKELREMVEKGLPSARQEMPPYLAEYWEYRDSMYAVEGLLMCKDRVLVPPQLRQEVLEGLHAAHQGTVAMTTRAQGAVIWPGITHDIQNTRSRCMTCNRNAPSNARPPPEEPRVPSMPFESVCMDFFTLDGWHYLVMVDRFSGWCEIKRAKSGTSTAGSQGLITAMRQLFAVFGIPCEISSDGGPEFVASETKDFFERWGVNHRLSSAYHPQSNGRAELGVKAMKRLLRDNIGPGGSLNTDEFLRALLMHRNTPDPISKRSPAEILFGRQLRDVMPVFGNTYTMFENEKVLPIWREGWSLKERALRTRAAKTVETLSEHSKKLPVLRHGDRVFIQNQTGNHPGKWDRTGVVVECRPHNQYTVKVDATGRLTLRNRQFLRKFTPSGKDVLFGIPAPVGEHHGSEGAAAHTDQPVTDTHTENVVLDDEVVNGNMFNSNPPTDLQSTLSVPELLPRVSPPESLRRSLRVTNPTSVYDANTGKYVERQT